jgi:hypothetical protein
MANSIGPPARRSRTGLIAGLVVVGSVVLGGGAGIYILANGENKGTAAPATGSDPRTVVNRFADAYARTVTSTLPDFDLVEFEPILCDRDHG